MDRRLLIVSLSAVPLTGCQMMAVIGVEGALPEPTFRLMKGGLFRTRLDSLSSLSVSEVGLLESDFLSGPRSAWAVTATRPNASIVGGHKVRYGHLPSGAKEEHPAERLREGALYLVYVDGNGYLGGAFFSYVGGNLIVVEGSGDLPESEARRKLREAMGSR